MTPYEMELRDQLEDMENQLADQAVMLTERDAAIAEAATDLRKAAEWVVEDVGIPFDMGTMYAPPAALRQAIYAYAFEDPRSTIHGGDLDYEGLVAFADEQGGWVPVEVAP